MESLRVLSLPGGRIIRQAGSRVVSGGVTSDLGVLALDTSEGLVNGRSHRSRHRQGKRQDSSQASSVDSTTVRSSWWDTSSESDLQTDLAGFSYTSFRR